jgi:hypothetical protein
MPVPFVSYRTGLLRHGVLQADRKQEVAFSARTIAMLPGFRRHEFAYRNLDAQLQRKPSLLLGENSRSSGFLTAHHDDPSKFSA